jgi:hypothetical protein
VIPAARCKWQLPDLSGTGGGVAYSCTARIKSAIRAGDISVTGKRSVNEGLKFCIGRNETLVESIRTLGSQVNDLCWLLGTRKWRRNRNVEVGFICWSMPID